METMIPTEFSDGSFLSATVKDGNLVECPDIRISPPNKRGGGSLSLKQAIDFLNDINNEVLRQISLG